MSSQSNEFTIPRELFDFKDLYAKKPGSPTNKRRLLAKHILGIIQRKERTIPVTEKNRHIISWLKGATKKHTVTEVVWYLKQELNDEPEKPVASDGATRDRVWGNSRLA